MAPSIYLGGPQPTLPVCSLFWGTFGGWIHRKSSVSALWGCSNAAAALTQLESPQLPTWMEYMMILKQRVAKIFGSQSEWLSRWLGRDGNERGR